MPKLLIVAQLPTNRDSIYFGAWIRLQIETGKEEIDCRIVGVDELQLDKSNISIDSPTAKALIGKSLYDSVQVKTPIAETRYNIIAIKYEIKSTC